MSQDDTSTISSQERHSLEDWIASNMIISSQLQTLRASAGNVALWELSRSTLITMVQQYASNDSNMPNFLKEALQVMPLKLRGRDEMKAFVDGGANRSSAAFLLHLFYIEAEAPSLPSGEYWSEKITKLEDAFSRTFVGAGASTFMEALGQYQKIYNINKHYGRSITIIQSSCSGKSRLVKEISKSIPVLSICLRELPYVPEAGWPPGDESVVKFINKSGIYAEIMAAALIGGVMQAAFNRLVSLDPSLRLDACLAEWNLADEQRPSFFRKAVRLADHLLRQSPDFPPENVNEDDRLTTWYQLLFKALCQEPAKRLARELTKRGFSRFILAFDECSYLNRSRADKLAPYTPQRGMTLVSVLRIIKAQDMFQAPGFNFWYLFLDTNPAIGDFFPAKRERLSGRLTNHELLPPWPYIGFDMFKPKTLSNTPSEALNFLWLKQYGRPYWNTQPDDAVLRAATLKLYTGHDRLDPGDKDHVLATFSNRVGVELGVGEAANISAVNGVRRHMRILLGIKDSRFAITTTASEPMLAVAGKCQLKESSEVYKTAIKTLVEEIVLKGLVMDKGRQGDLYNRLLFILASDWAIPESLQPLGRSLEPIPLDAWFKCLLGPDLGSGSSSDSASLRARFFNKIENTYISFTHFVHIDENIDLVSTRWLYELWCRGAAVQCAANQPVIDGFFVVYVGDLSAPFDPLKLSYVAWQTKFRDDPALSTTVSQLVGPLIEGEPSPRRPKDSIVLFMDIGTTTPFKSDPKVTCELSHVPTHHPSHSSDSKSRKWRGYMEDQKKEPARWCLNIRGNTTRTFPMLEEYSAIFRRLFEGISKYTDPKLEKYANWMVSALKHSPTAKGSKLPPRSTTPGPASMFLDDDNYSEQTSAHIDAVNKDNRPKLPLSQDQQQQVAESSTQGCRPKKRARINRSNEKVD